MDGLFIFTSLVTAIVIILLIMFTLEKIPYWYREIFPKKQIKPVVTSKVSTNVVVKGFKMRKPSKTKSRALIIQTIKEDKVEEVEESEEDVEEDNLGVSPV